MPTTARAGWPGTPSSSLMCTSMSPSAAGHRRPRPAVSTSPTCSGGLSTTSGPFRYAVGISYTAMFPMETCLPTLAWLRSRT